LIFDGPVKSRETGDKVKKIQIQGAQILRNEAYLLVHRSDEGCSATQKLDFLRSRQFLMMKKLAWVVEM